MLLVFALDYTLKKREERIKRWKEINLIEREVCHDHVYILVEIPLKLSVLSFTGFLKGKTSIMIYQKYGNIKFKYRNRNFWFR